MRQECATRIQQVLITEQPMKNKAGVLKVHGGLHVAEAVLILTTVVLVTSPVRGCHCPHGTPRSGKVILAPRY